MAILVGCSDRSNLGARMRRIPAWATWPSEAIDPPSADIPTLDSFSLISMEDTYTEPPYIVRMSTSKVLAYAGRPRNLDIP